jgi:hypothetical protein
MNSRRTRVIGKESNHVPGDHPTRDLRRCQSREPLPAVGELRQTPVGFREDGPDEAGTYVVSTYREIEALLHDPRISSEWRPLHCCWSPAMRPP